MNTILLSTTAGLDKTGIVLIALLVLAIIILSSGITIVPQAYAYVVERLGVYRATWNVGLHYRIPFFDKISRKVPLMERIADFPPQPVITEDNCTIQIDTVVFYQITDPKAFAYGVERPMQAIGNLSATTLRNIIGDLELDETFTSRDIINSKMRTILDEATDPWGIKVTRVEVKNIEPPREIKEAMEKQMKAEREKREAILRAEGTKQSAILVAEGKKEAAILEAEAKKQVAIREAEGQAAAIYKIHEAKAQGLKMLKDVEADQAVLTLKSFESLEKVADGQSTKIIIPSEIQSLAGLAASLKEVTKD